MDDRKLDTIARNLASGTSRRGMLKGLLGLGGIAIAGVGAHDARAARRGFTGPSFPHPVPTEPPCINPDTCVFEGCCAGFICCNGQECIPEDAICGVT
jgi:hypothetical protein